MLGRFVVGLVVTALAVNLVLVPFLVVHAVGAATWETLLEKLRPDPFRRFAPKVSASSGWQMLVTNVMLAIALAAYAVAFCANAPVGSPGAFVMFGFVALVVAQIANVKSKLQQARTDRDRVVAASALASIPWAILGAPVAWLAYVGVALTFTAGEGPLDFIGQALSAAALGLGDWLIIRVVAGGLFLLFAFQAATALLLAPVAFAMMRAEKAAPAAPVSTRGSAE